MTYPLSDAMQDAGQTASALGLGLCQFNSGSRHNPANGFRVFREASQMDYFGGNHIAHLNTRKEVLAFLAGYAASRTEG